MPRIKSNVSNPWRTDKTKIGPDGKPVRFPLSPDVDKSALPELSFPPRRPDEDGGANVGEWEHFNIVFIYEDDSTETVPIAAIDADDALNRALEIRQKDSSVKIKTSIVQDGIGDVVSQLAMGIEKYGSQVIGLGGRAARFGGRVATGIGHIGAETMRGTALAAGRTSAVYQSVKREYATGKLERLIRDGGGDNPARRALARRQIQTEYPQIYRHIAWERV